MFRHYALNVPLYTDFTIPIRRFADVVVHRTLAAVLGIFFFDFGNRGWEQHSYEKMLHFAECLNTGRLFM